MASSAGPGGRFPSEGVEWWIKFMGRTPVSTIVGFNAAINYSDIRADLPKIACPTFVITTDESGLASVDETRAWQRTIRNSELLVVPGNSFHVAASDPDRCARATLDFIDRHGGA
jgi:3-oxoadipate enol-lactonase